MEDVRKMRTSVLAFTHMCASLFRLRICGPVFAAASVDHDAVAESTQGFYHTNCTYTQGMPWCNGHPVGIKCRPPPEAELDHQLLATVHMSHPVHTVRTDMSGTGSVLDRVLDP